jgi:membrane-associated phospholipid phosphatase
MIHISPPRLRYALLLFLCATITPSIARSDDPALPELTPAPTVPSTGAEASSRKRSFGTQLVYDTKYVLTAPLRWDSRDWLWFGAATAAVVGTGILADKRESDPVEDAQHRVDKLATKLEPFGGGYSFAALAGFYGAGKLFDSPNAIAVAEDGLTASIIAAGIISPAIKWVVGRVRPGDTSSSTDFHPFGSNHSFPSGHTTQAFTVASVISAHYDSLWIDAAAYTTAALVGYARHQHQAHWPSDIAAGALIGIAVGHTVVKLNNENRGAHVAIVPSDNGPMVALVIPIP